MPNPIKIQNKHSRYVQIKLNVNSFYSGCIIFPLENECIHSKYLILMRKEKNMRENLRL